MKKIIFWLIVIGALYYYRNSIPIVKNFFESKDVASVTDTIKQKLTEQTATDTIKSWALKDGIRLPQDWKLEERVIGDTKFTAMIPPNPKDVNDYIVLSLDKAYVSKLPTNHTCKEAEKTATCLVGNNYETLKTFSILTFVK